MKPYESGAQKRKKKKEQEAKIAKLTKIDTFLSNRPLAANRGNSSSDRNLNFDGNVCETHNSSSNSDVVTDKEIQPQSESCSSNLFSVTLDLDNKPKSDTSVGGVGDAKGCKIVTNLPEEVVLESFEEINQGNETDADKSVQTCTFNPSNKYPSDRYHFSENVTDDIKLFIVNHGPCKPKGPFPKDTNQNNRCFSKKYYEKVTKTGMIIPREWLCYSVHGDYVFCQSCWLFADRSSAFYHSNWVNGVRDWKGLGKKINVHESSNIHVQACITFDLWKRCKTIDSSLESVIQKEENTWCKILHRIVNVTLTLASCNLAFRGHREEIGKPNSGNFLSVIELLAKYDHVLQELLTNDPGHHRYLSPSIQNELIQILSDRVKSEIVTDICNAQFFSVIVDTTQDITKKDQLSLVIRYVTLPTNSSGMPVALEVNESFLGFKKVDDQSAGGLEHVILKELETNGLSLSKCRGQGYDGAATMSGIYSGLRTRIQEKQRTAKYVHCASHNLNLVVNDAMSGIPENVNFFGTLEQLYVFFSQSIKRWELLSLSSRTLKKLCPTRWSSRTDSLKALRYSYTDVMKALSNIILLSANPKERSEAMGLKKQLESFSFIFLIVVQTKILETINVASKRLQNEDYDLFDAATQLETVSTTLSDFRNDFDEMKSSAAQLANAWGVNTQFEEKRNRKVKKHFDELCQDERLTNSEKHFKVTVFYATWDTVISQLSTRFEAMKEINNLFSLLSPKILLEATDVEILNKVNALVEEYEEDLTVDLHFQINSFRKALKSDIEKKTSIRQLADLLFLQNSSIASSFPDLCTLFLIFLTLPVTVASAERSFSKLKIIKNYLRSTMSQQRLSGLSILSIENQRARNLDLKEIVKIFASMKARRKERFLKKSN